MAASCPPCFVPYLWFIRRDHCEILKDLCVDVANLNSDPERATPCSWLHLTKQTSGHSSPWRSGLLPKCFTSSSLGNSGLGRAASSQSRAFSSPLPDTALLCRLFSLTGSKSSSNVTTIREFQRSRSQEQPKRTGTPHNLWSLLETRASPGRQSP